MNSALTIVARSCVAVLALAACDSATGGKSATTERLAAPSGTVGETTPNATVGDGTAAAQPSSSPAPGPPADLTSVPVSDGPTTSTRSGIRLITFTEPGGLAALFPAAELVVMDGCLGLRTSERNWQPIAWPDQAELSVDASSVHLGSKVFVVGGVADYAGGAVEIAAADRIEPGMSALLEACAYGQTTFWAVKP